MTEETRSLTYKFGKIDYVGLFFFLCGWTLLILALVWGGSSYPWNSGRIIALLVVGVVLLALFILNEYLLESRNSIRIPSFLRPLYLHATPMIPLEIFKDLDVVICQWNNLSSGMVLFGQFYYIAIYFTIVFSYSPQQAGQQLLYFLPGLGAGTFSAIFLVNYIFHGTKLTIIFGSVTMAAGTGLFSMAVQEKNKPELYGFMVMLGVGVGLVPTTDFFSKTRLTETDYDAGTTPFSSTHDALPRYRYLISLLLPYTRRNLCVNNHVLCRQQQSLRCLFLGRGSKFIVPQLPNLHTKSATFNSG